MEDGMGDVFDHIEDLLDFPCDEDVMGLGLGLGLAEPCNQSRPLHLPLSSPVDDGLLGEDNQDGKAGAALSADEGNLGPCDELDIEQLEWMSKFLDDPVSFSLDLPSCDAIAKNVDAKSAQNKSKDHSSFRTSSPVSVFEANAMAGGGGSRDSYPSSSSSSSSTSASYSNRGNGTRATLPPPPSPPETPSVPVIPARARSKRARPATFSAFPHVAIPYLPPSSDVVSSDLESFGESCPSPPPPKKKQSKRKSPAAAGDESGAQAPGRRCMHCEIQKTPQWRAGPMGPKTLCNACGVRYKSGRLYPEYRPAASPTFVPSLHSNSHKKVVEMRMKASQKAADGCDLLDYIRRRE